MYKTRPHAPVQNANYSCHGVKKKQIAYRVHLGGVYLGDVRVTRVTSLLTVCMWAPQRPTAPGDSGSKGVCLWGRAVLKEQKDLLYDNRNGDALYFVVKAWARHKTTERVLAVGGGWQLAVGSWRWLAVGGWWLVVGGWRSMVGGPREVVLKGCP